MLRVPRKKLNLLHLRGRVNLKEREAERLTRVEKKAWTSKSETRKRREETDKRERERGEERVRGGRREAGQEGRGSCIRGRLGGRRLGCRHLRGADGEARRRRQPERGFPAGLGAPGWRGVGV